MMTAFKTTHVSAGAVAVLVGYTGSIAILFQLFAALGLDQVQISGWMLVLGVGSGLCSIGLSLWARQPLLAVWSTPGAALLATSLPNVPLSEIIGAFLFCAALLVATGLSGLMNRLSDVIPNSIANGLLAGVLFPFVLACFAALQTDPGMVLIVIASFVMVAHRRPQYAIFAALIVGALLAVATDAVHWPKSTVWAIHLPQFIPPSFSLPTMIGLGLPLYIVTMCSQNIPGIAVQRSFGYRPPVSVSLAITGFISAILASFGGFAFNLAAISASLCAGPDADPDPNNRYRASVIAGLFYILAGLGGGSVVALALAAPPTLIATIAGLALLGTFSGSLAQGLATPPERMPVLVTFLTTVSGISFWGIGAAFWGLLFGLILYHGLPRLIPSPKEA